MLYIIHGDDIISARKRLTDLSSGFAGSIFLLGDKVTSFDILNALSSNDMFQSEKCVIIEKISKLPKADLDRLLPIFEKIAKEKEITLILFQDSEMTKQQIGKYKTVITESFLLPKLFFHFLDNFTPKNMATEIYTLSKMTSVDEMQIFYALVKRVRQMLLIKANGSFDELLKMSPWQLGKLQTQSASWKKEALEHVYFELFKLEKDLKSSGLMLPLKKHLDIMMASALH